MSARPHSQVMPSRTLFPGAAAATTAVPAAGLSLGAPPAHAADSAYVMGSRISFAVHRTSVRW